MKNSNLSQLCCLPCALSAVSCVAMEEDAAPKPNFVFVITDDQRWDAMGVVQKEQGENARFPWFKSPAMDRLASEGVRFRNAFVTLSLCSPSRAAFLTGQYGHINGIRKNNRGLPLNSVTHATLLRDAGYQTASAMARVIFKACFSSKSPSLSSLQSIVSPLTYEIAR